ncbi:MAG TPA: helix-turn-helix transcriptional regulator [Candidatus Nanoarchaeia archaeon]
MAIDINDHFGRKVKDTRRELGLSQLELAEVSKVDLSTINRLERGEANITLRNAFKISKALKIPLSDLLKV